MRTAITLLQSIVRQVASLGQRILSHIAKTRYVRELTLAGAISGVMYAFILVYKGESESLDTFAFQWFPGLVFGFVLARVQQWPNHVALSFASISAVVYFAAVQIVFVYFSVFSKSTGGVPEPTLPEYVIAGFLAGGFGAFTLSWTSKLFGDSKRVASQAVLTTLIGMATGPIFIILFLQNASHSRPVEATTMDDLVFFIKTALTTSAAYISWQLAVGLRVDSDLQNSERIASAEKFSQRLSSFLQGPIVQLIGLIGSVLGIVSFFQ